MGRFQLEGVLAFMASSKNSPFCLIFPFLLLGNHGSSSPRRPKPQIEEPTIWLYSVIAPMNLLDSLPGLSFVKVILSFYFLATLAGVLPTD